MVGKTECSDRVQRRSGTEDIHLQARYTRVQGRSGTEDIHLQARYTRAQGVQGRRIYIYRPGTPEYREYRDGGSTCTGQVHQSTGTEDIHVQARFTKVKGVQGQRIYMYWPGTPDCKVYRDDGCTCAGQVHQSTRSTGTENIHVQASYTRVQGVKGQMIYMYRQVTPEYKEYRDGGYTCTGQVHQIARCTGTKDIHVQARYTRVQGVHRRRIYIYRPSTPEYKEYRDGEYTCTPVTSEYRE